MSENKQSMKRWLRLFYYLAINVAVSACTILAVLTIWERTRPLINEALPGLTPEPTAQFTPVTAASPTSEDPIEQRPAIVEYRVKEGDTLGTIAAEFDTTIQALIDANNIANPDRLIIGEIILIPLQPLPTAQTQEPVGTTAPTPTLPSLPAATTPTPIPADVTIPIEIVTVVGAGALENEQVIIRYSGDDSISLRDWQLAAPSGSVYTFPQLSLFNNGAITVYSRQGVDTVVELYWNLTAPVWRSGETVILRDAQGIVRASADVP